MVSNWVRRIAAVMAGVVVASVLVVAPTEIASAAGEATAIGNVGVVSTHSDNLHWSFRITRDQQWSPHEGTTRYEWWVGDTRAGTGKSFSTTSVGAVELTAYFVRADNGLESAIAQLVRRGSPVPLGATVVNEIKSGPSVTSERKVTSPTQRVNVGTYLYESSGWSESDGSGPVRIRKSLQYWDGTHWRRVAARWTYLGFRIPRSVAGRKLRILERTWVPGAPYVYRAIPAGRAHR